MFIQEEGQEAHTVTFLANKGPMQPRQTALKDKDLRESSR